MPVCQPEEPEFANGAEHEVWRRLRDQLRPTDLLLSNLRISDHAKDHELDVVVALPGAGVVVVEVKGGSVWHDGVGWRQDRGTSSGSIHPVDQARDGKYALRTLVENDPRWRGRTRVRWAHAVCLPHTSLPDDFFTPDLDRWAVVDRSQLGDLAGVLWDVPVKQESGCRAPDDEDVALIAEILRGRGLPQRDVVAVALDRESSADQLTLQQATILGAIQLLNRVEVRGGAGSGKTYLAVEQARRLSAAGQRVALLCYSRGLAAYLTRHVEGIKRQHRPAYVGTFHGLGQQWGAPSGSENDSDFWEQRLPAQMAELAAGLSPGHRFDAVVIDEAQDFADSWWQPLMTSLKDPDQGGVYAFTDEGQRIFPRYGEPPVPLVTLLLDHNLRNTRQIADAFHPLARLKMRLLGEEGPAVRFVSTPWQESVDAADDEVEKLLESGWRPEDVALLTTGSRHPQQSAQQELGQDAYWESFWDTEQVFYGHVLGFKGLERRAVVLAINEDGDRERIRERLYVGLSRARDELVVCGDPEVVRRVAGDQVAKRLGLG